MVDYECVAGGRGPTGTGYNRVILDAACHAVLDWLQRILREQHGRALRHARKVTINSEIGMAAFASLLHHDGPLGVSSERCCDQR